MKCISSDYEVNPLTMALLSVAHVEYSTIAVERDRRVYVRKSPLEIIKSACLDGGASYEGRRKAVCHLIGATQKVPIPINPLHQIFAFPTHSPKAFECSWIFHHHIKSIHPSHDPTSTAESMITFKNHLILPMNESYYILHKQYQRTALCILQFTGSGTYSRELVSVGPSWV